MNRTGANILYYFFTQKKSLPVEMFCFPALHMVFHKRKAKLDLALAFILIKRNDWK